MKKFVYLHRYDSLDVVYPKCEDKVGSISDKVQVGI